MLQRTAINFKHLLPEMIVQDAKTLAEIVMASRQIVESATDAQEAEAFAKAMLALGEAIASASGGGFLGFGSKIDKNERAVLTVLSKLLKLD